MSLSPQQIENLPTQQKLQVIQLKQYWASQNMGANAPYVQEGRGEGREERKRGGGEGREEEVKGGKGRETGGGGGG